MARDERVMGGVKSGSVRYQLGRWMVGGAKGSLSVGPHVGTKSRIKWQWLSAGMSRHMDQQASAVQVSSEAAQTTCASFRPLEAGRGHVYYCRESREL